MPMGLRWGLATTNRPRVSNRERHCRKFPRIRFDHRAKLDCCYSCSVPAGRRSQKFWGRRALPFWNGASLTLETRFYHTVLA